MPDRRRVVTAGLCSLLALCAPIRAHAMQRAIAASTPPVSDQQRPSNGRILVIGDSLSAEYGLPRDSGWVARIAERLRAEDTGYQIHNASISGDTSSGGLSRLPAELQRIQP